MSTDQWDASEIVRVRMRCEDAEPFEEWLVKMIAHAWAADGSEKWSKAMTRKDAERWLSSWTWILYPVWKGQAVRSAAIVRWNAA